MIAKLFKEIGWVEELGSGVRNTFKYCELYNKNTKPEFIESDTFKTIIPLKSSGEMTGEISMDIINLLKQNPSMTIPKISEIIGVSTSTIERKIRILQKQNKLIRIGSTKAGQWKIL
jgi:ATP-dependent DNA helicase RecG